MYAQVNGRKYAVADVETSRGVRLVFPDTPVEDVDALAAAMPAQFGVYTDQDNIIFDIRGFTIATLIEKSVQTGAVTLHLRQPNEAETKLSALEAQQQAAEQTTQQAIAELSILIAAGGAAGV